MTGEQLEAILASGDMDLIASTARLLLAALNEAEDWMLTSRVPREVPGPETEP